MWCTRVTATSKIFQYTSLWIQIKQEASRRLNRIQQCWWPIVNNSPFCYYFPSRCLFGVHPMFCIAQCAIIIHLPYCTLYLTRDAHLFSHLDPIWNLLPPRPSLAQRHPLSHAHQAHRLQTSQLHPQHLKDPFFLAHWSTVTMTSLSSAVVWSVPH